MMRALLILTAQERAIFSERAATEGVHKSRMYPTGASLLGWAARSLYDRFEEGGEAHEVFHSGRVRFSDALPVGSDGRVAYPMPRILQRQKAGKRPATEPEQGEDSRLTPDLVWVGRRAFKADNTDYQPEPLGGFVTESLRIPDVATGGRLRTATREGQAVAGQLFGYTHLEPVSLKEDAEAPRRRYAATIEADNESVDASAWRSLREAFEGQILRLGRAAATGYGGWYECEWREGDNVPDVWPACKAVEGSKSGDGVLVRVWALSDLAILGRAGAPTLAPRSEELGLPASGMLVGEESAVTARRFAPWNSYLDCRDVERIAIGAGSVLTYRYDGGMPKTDTIRLAGLWQEQGLGRIWVDPPMLRGKNPEADMEVRPIAAEAERRERAEAGREPPPGIAAWAKRMADLSDTKARKEVFRAWTAELDGLLRNAEGEGPSASQWHAAAVAARRAPDHAGVIHALFEPPSPACGEKGARTRSKDWGAKLRFRPREAGEEPTVRQWLRERIEGQSGLPIAQLSWLLDRLAKHEADRRRGQKDGREQGEQRHG